MQHLFPDCIRATNVSCLINEQLLRHGYVLLALALFEQCVARM